MYDMILTVTGSLPYRLQSCLACLLVKVYTFPIDRRSPRFQALPPDASLQPLAFLSINTRPVDQVFRAIYFVCFDFFFCVSVAILCTPMHSFMQA